MNYIEKLKATINQVPYNSHGPRVCAMKPSIPLVNDTTMNNNEKTLNCTDEENINHNNLINIHLGDNQEIHSASGNIQRYSNSIIKEKLSSQNNEDIVDNNDHKPIIKANNTKTREVDSRSSKKKVLELPPKLAMTNEKNNNLLCKTQAKPKQRNSSIEKNCSIIDSIPKLEKKGEHTRNQSSELYKHNSMKILRESQSTKKSSLINKDSTASKMLKGRIMTINTTASTNINTPRMQTPNERLKLNAKNLSIAPKKVVINLENAGRQYVAQLGDIRKSKNKFENIRKSSKHISEIDLKIIKKFPSKNGDNILYLYEP